MNRIMKYLLTTAVLLSFLTFMACDGPVGPEGPAGVDGQPGEIGFVMEWEGIDFTSTNEYSIVLDFNDFNFESLDSDVALAFLLDEQASFDAGTDVWLPLPQLFILGEDLIQYGYDFTKFDASIFLEANFDLNLLDSEFTDGKVVRIVVVPGEFVGGRKAGSKLSYLELEEKLGLPKLKPRTSL